MKDLIFKPNKELLEEARQRRLDRWQELDKTKCSREQALERMKVDVEIYKSMEILRERAIQCIEMSKQLEVIEG